MRLLPFICMVALVPGGCAMLQAPAEPVAYQAPVASKPAPVVKKAAAPKKVVRKPIVQPAPTNERSEPSGGGDPDKW